MADVLDSSGGGPGAVKVASVDAEVPAPGGQNPRAAGREGERERSSLMQGFFCFVFL